MQQATVTLLRGEGVPANTLDFYRSVIRVLNQSELQYLVGGAYALNHHTGINRLTKDFDIFIARNAYDRIEKVLVAAGFDVELTYPHWLAKVHYQGDFIDLIFNSGNGVAEVDQLWFDHAVAGEIFGIQTLICPVEETIWSKAFIMERERFDGADVAHLLLAKGRQLDWWRLLHRFEPHWRILLSHLTLFGLIYPAHREVVPVWVMDILVARLQAESHAPSPPNKICGGTLLSREQYLNDLSQWGYTDARLAPHGKMSEHDAAIWTDAIKKNKR